MSALLEITRRERLLRVALNRPEKRNALSMALCRELVDALERAAKDPGVGAILLGGKGPSFCAGMDLSELRDPDLDAMNQVQEELFTIGARLGKPIVAAVHGAALAGGTGLAANCHVVVAAEEATFGLPEIRLGLWPFTVLRAMTLAIGERRAVELALTGRILTAKEAWEFGLVHHVLPEAGVDARAESLAMQLSHASMTAIQSGLYFVQETRGENWTKAGELAARARKEIFAGGDAREGVAAFFEKREPHWPSIRPQDVGHPPKTPH